MTRDPVDRDELYDAALALPEAERGEFLAGACGDDAELRAQLERLLEIHERAAGYLEKGPSPLELVHKQTRGEGTQAAEDDEAAPIGELGPYVLRRELGRGGQGTVYLAHDTRLDRSVALKVLPLFFSNNSDAVARLEREARVSSKLDHPGLATVYEAGDVGSTLR